MAEARSTTTGVDKRTSTGTRADKGYDSWELGAKLRNIEHHANGLAMRLVCLLPAGLWPAAPTLDHIADALIEYYGPIAPLLHQKYQIDDVIAVTELARRQTNAPIVAGAREANGDQGRSPAGHIGSIL